MAKRKKTRTQKESKRGVKTGLFSDRFFSAGFFISLSVITLLTFISFELAVICLGFLALTSTGYYALKQRRLWEQATSFKFQKTERRYEKLARTVAKNNDDIALLKKSIDGEMLDLEDFGFRPRRKSTAAVRSVTQKPAPLSAKKKQKKKVAPTITNANENMFTGDDGLSDIVVRELVHSAIRKQHIDVFVQPIMRLPQRQIRFFEVYGRVRAKAGVYLPAARYMELATEDRLIDGMDHLLLIECIKTIKETAHLTKAAPFFINITSATITNPRFMKKLLEFISNNRALAPRLVFEIQQEDFDDMHPAVLEILRGLGKLGCSLSIDHVQNLDFDIKFLQVLRVRYVKIKADDLLQKIREENAHSEIHRLKRRLEGNGIGFIVERLESEKDLLELLDYNINYGQGFLFGRPALQSAYQALHKKSA